MPCSKRFCLLMSSAALLTLAACDRNPVSTQAADPLRGDNHEFYPGDYSEDGLIGNSLPGSWRPFADDSPWNTPIPQDAPTHPHSDLLMFTVQNEAKHLKLIRSYLTPVWVVNSKTIPGIRVRSDRIFDTWDQDEDGWTDPVVPVTRAMYPEPTGDGQLCIVDPFKHMLWDLSTFSWPATRPFPSCTTFDVWDLTGKGVATPPENSRWIVRGGRGSGFPALAGVIRPEELDAGQIRHALCLTFNKNRRHVSGDHLFLPPACRSDGSFVGHQYPVMGMRFQLDPTLNETDFQRWGLTREGKIVARALQTYGMYLGLTGGAMKLEVQLLGPTTEANRQQWERRFPGFYETIERIPTSHLRVIDTGTPVRRFKR